MWVAFGLPLLASGGFAAWLLAWPAWQAHQLEARAEAGDPVARAAVDRERRVAAVLQRALLGDDADRRRLLASGTPARATIVGVKQLGLSIGHEPVQAHVVEVTLSVDGDARRVTVIDAVPGLRAGRLAVGASVAVRVDPLNADSVVVLWDAP